MAHPTNRRRSPHLSAREALWEDINRHAGPFTHVMRMSDAANTRARLSELDGVSTVGWLVTAFGEVCALFRRGEAWVLFDEFIDDGEVAVNVTVSAPTFVETIDVVATLIELHELPDAWSEAAGGAA